jgi:hypothetical protein
MQRACSNPCLNFYTLENINMSHSNSDQYKSCIEACYKCATACETCLHEMLGKQSHNDCPACCYECLESCLQCMRALIRDSSFAAQYCALCADICNWCAEQCSSHNMEHCQKCAQACHDCAEECLKIAA